MLIAFYICSVFLFVISHYFFKRWVNPCSVYVIIWFAIVTLYNLNLIYYAPLISVTYRYIIVFEIAISLGLFLGNKFALRFSNKKSIAFSNSDDFDDRKFNSVLDKAIIVTAVLSSISIIPNFIIVVRKYGISDIMSNVASIYQAREAGEIDYVNYFSPIIFVTLVLMSIRIKKYGFKSYFLFVYLLAVINALSFGGRNYIVYTIILATTPILIYRDNVIQQTFFKKYRTRILVFIALAGSGYVLYLINYQRAINTVISPYISPVMANLVKINYSFYKTFQYLTEPLAYLNSYLKDPYYSFGGNTFSFWYKQINRFGFDIPRIESLPFRNIPMSCNVGTYITELIIDFGNVFSVFVIFIFGFLMGRFYCRSLKNQYDVEAISLTSLLYISIILSFFMWHVRGTNMWIATIISIIVGRVISSKSKNTFSEIR